MENQVGTNTYKKNLQTLSMMLDTYIDNCITYTDWENNDSALRESEKLYQKIMKASNSVFGRIGVPVINLHLQNGNQQNQESNLSKEQQHAKKMNGNTDQLTDNNLANQTTGSSNQQEQNGETTKQTKEDLLYNTSLPRHQESEKPTMHTVNKADFEEEPTYCQKVVINAHPFKQRLANQQQRAQQDAKLKLIQTDDEYNPDHSSDSDFKSSDEEFSAKKKKLIQKKKDNGYFSYNSHNNNNKPRGRPPNFSHNESGASSIQTASSSEQKRVLSYFNDHYDPQKRNKIWVINQITKLFNYSYSSVYYLVSKQSTSSDSSEYQDTNHKHKQQSSHRPQSDFQNSLQKQQQQQYQFYQSHVNHKNDTSSYGNGYNRYSQQSSSHQHHDLQKRNPTYYEQYKQQLKDNKTSNSDRYANNLIHSQSQNSSNFRKGYPGSSNSQQQQQQNHYQSNFYHAGQEQSQTDSDSAGVFQRQQPQKPTQAENDLFRDFKTSTAQHQLKQPESRNSYEQSLDPSQKQYENTNRLGSTENRNNNVFNEFHRSASSRDTIQMQQQAEQ